MNNVQQTKVNAWRFHRHRFIDHLADGKDPEKLSRSLDASRQALREGGFAEGQNVATGAVFDLSGGRSTY